MRKRVKRPVSKTARFAAREMIDEFQSAQTKWDVKIDAADLVAQVASSRARPHLNHLYTWNHRWMALLAERNRRSAARTYDFIDEVMPHAMFTIDQFEVIRSRRDEILDGLIVDLGVYRGKTTRALTSIFRDRTIHGFDSFEGLPEDCSHMPKGFFGELQGVLPSMPPNVKLYKGWFDETLPGWAAEHADTPIALVRVDCDLYSSTKTALDELGPLFRPGTWIVFDELIGYRGFEEHEYKAFMEFVEETGYEYDYLAYGLTYTIVRLGERSQ